MTGSSSVIIGAPTSGGRPSDSDVRLVPETVRGASDSDVQLASPGLKQPSDSDVTLIKEDTADHGVISGSGSSSETSVRVSPLLGSSAEVPAADVRQRLRAQSLERADRCPSARFGKRFRAERARCQRRVRSDADVEAQ